MAGVSFNFGVTDKEIAELRAREREEEERAARERAEGQMLVDIGKHCAVCRQKTFLPFVCAHCGLSLCTQHRFDHGCKAAPSGAQAADGEDRRPTWFVPFPITSTRRATSRALQVTTNSPICGSVVDVRAGQSADAAVSAHIDAGCPKPRTCQTFRCCCPGCKTEELVPVICPNCGQNTCLKHRFSADHPCKARTAASPAEAVQRNPKDTKQSSSNREKLTRSAEQNARAALFADVQKKSQKKQGGLFRKVELMRNKAAAQGNPSVPLERRAFFEVVFPLKVTAAAATQTPPTFMYFDTKWSIGKSLSPKSACQHGNRSKTTKQTNSLGRNRSKGQGHQQKPYCRSTSLYSWKSEPDKQLQQKITFLEH